MAFAERNPIKRIDLAAGVVGLGPGAEVVADILPGIAALVIRAERAAGIIPAVHHAVLAARVARDAVHHAVLVPVHLVQHLLVAGVVAVGHQVTGRFPALDVARGNGPGGAGQLAFAGQELLIDRRAKDGKALAPFLDLGELLRSSWRA